MFSKHGHECRPIFFWDGIHGDADIGRDIALECASAEFDSRDVGVGCSEDAGELAEWGWQLDAFVRLVCCAQGEGFCSTL